jgi:hypothetical protein
VGRYLFFDDEEIEARRGLTRAFHTAAKHDGNPTFAAERPWEGAVAPSTVLFDEEERAFKLWYTTFARAPGAHGTFVNCYATSSDGVHWERPELGIFEYDGSTRNNLCALDAGALKVIKDEREPDPARRYKALYWGSGSRSGPGALAGWMGSTGGVWGICLSSSPDGARWTPHPDNPVLTGSGDTESLHGWDDRYGKYVAYIRPGRRFRPEERPGVPRRVIGRSESDDCVAWTEPAVVLVPDADDDPSAELYVMHASWYHGHYVGLLHVFVPSPDPFGPFWPELASSRDGIRWRRPAGRRPLIEFGPPGSWDGGMIGAAKGIIPVGDELWIYYGGWREDHGTSRPHRRMETDRTAQRRAAAVGLARLRLDGFVSLDAGEAEGELLTRPVTCGGRSLEVNARCADGQVVAAVLDASGGPIEGFTREDCAPFRGDRVRQTMAWRGRSELGRLRGATVRVGLWARNAELYSFAI